MTIRPAKSRSHVTGAEHGPRFVSAPQRPMFSMGSQATGFSVTPIAGDARTTPVGIGFVGTF